MRLYRSFFYKARNWSTLRRSVVEAERAPQEINLRFIVASRAGSNEEIFHWYQ